MKDQNKLIIGVVIIIVVAYFLFFKQKEQFTVNKESRDIVPEELMIYTYLILPTKLGQNHPDVLKARELIEYYFHNTGFPRDKVNEFGSNFDFIDKKYSNYMKELERIRQERKDSEFLNERKNITPAPQIKPPKEYIKRGRENDIIKFECPVRDGYIIYGMGAPRAIRYNIQPGTRTLTINNKTMGGDPFPGYVKGWEAKYVC